MLLLSTIPVSNPRIFSLLRPSTNFELWLMTMNSTSLTMLLRRSEPLQALHSQPRSSNSSIPQSPASPRFQLGSSSEPTHHSSPSSGCLNSHPSQKTSPESSTMLPLWLSSSSPMLRFPIPHTLAPTISRSASSSRTAQQQPTLSPLTHCSDSPRPHSHGRPLCPR